jgi:C-terminal processing protease CtpA/Prc
MRAWIRWRPVPSSWIARAFVSGSLTLGLAATAAAQSIAVDRQRGLQMLDQIREDLVEHYYDPAFHGLDLEALVDRARQRIGQAQSLGEIFGVLGGVCLDLKDSHTIFLPPQRVQDVHYGWSWRYVGDRALVDSIDDGGDARDHGLRVGDTVLDVAGYPMTRASERVIRYLLTSLRPQPQLVVTVERDGARRTVTVPARIRKRRARIDIDNELDRHVAEMQEAMAYAQRPKSRQEWIADGVLYWRLTDFYDDAATVRKSGEKLRRASRVILDLRDNPGGSAGVLLRIAGFFAPPGTPVVRMVARGTAITLVTEDVGEPFTGQIAVLVDARSGSSAEILARLLQLRGARVIGDRTVGAVLKARLLKHAAGDSDIKVLYAVIVANSDVFMPDGSRLEGVGVLPDVLALPAPDDLEKGLDPVLVKAASSFGVTIESQRAGRLSRQ